MAKSDNEITGKIEIRKFIMGFILIFFELIQLNMP